VAIAAAVALASTSCDSSDGGSPGGASASTSATPSAQSGAEAAKASKAADAEATAEARQQAADDAAGDKAAGAVARKAANQTTVNGSMMVVLTAYCNLQLINPSSAQEVESRDLEGVWSKFWQAGRWDKDIADASQQQGACPDAPAALPTTG
jgi:hypothetical protein